MDVDDPASAWRIAAQQEIDAIKPFLVKKCGWVVTLREEPQRTLLYVCMRQGGDSKVARVLRLAYGPNFPRERPREDFVNPEDYEQAGTPYWPDDGQQAFKSNRNPPVICLQGTWGFHHDLHKEKDPLQANINRLLRDVQICLGKAKRP